MKPTNPIIVLLLTALPVASAPPVLSPGTCTYLTGTPVGGTAATSDEPFDGVLIDDVCEVVLTVGVRGFGDDSVQIHMDGSASAGQPCHASAWVGHEFATEPLSGGTARVDVAGHVNGTFNYERTGLARSALGVRIEAVVSEVDPLTGVEERVGSAVLYERLGEDVNFRVDRDVAGTVPVTVRGATRYRVALVLTARSPYTTYLIDFGPPGTGRGARIDSIEVCIDAPPDDSALRARLDALEIADLEAKLYRKECMPGVWMPVAQGGKLETARQLVADRLAQATATADPNVNARVATMRLQSADEDITAGQYQRACRDLADGLRALTTP